MKYTFLTLIAVFTISIFGFSQQNKIKRKTTQILGYAYNYGTGEVETGGKCLSIDKSLIGPGDKIYFELVSGDFDKVSMVAVNKYDVWTNVFNNGKVKHQNSNSSSDYGYSLYFKSYYKNKDFKSYKVFVNGAHNQYNKQACVIKVLLVSEREVFEDDYKFVTELIAPNYQESYRGVTADGISKLRIDFYLPGVKKLNLKYPDCGGFEYANGNKGSRSNGSSTSIRLDETGHGYIYYTPPAYIDQGWWEELVQESPPITDMEKYGDEISKFSVDIPISFWYQNLNSKSVYDSCIIELYRPPIVFVHGFLGSLAT